MMKKCFLFIWLLLLAGVACGETILPPEVQQHVEAAYPGYQVEDEDKLPGHALVLLRQQEKAERTLLIFADNNGQWEPLPPVTQAIPQGKLPADISCEAAGDNYSPLWDDEGQYGYVSDGRAFTVATNDGEKTIEGVSFRWRDDGFHLVGYQYTAGGYVDVLGDELIFYDIGNGYSGSAALECSTELHNVDFQALPTSPAQAMGIDPVVPYTELRVMAQFDGAFEKGLRFPVYMGPGVGYGRSGGGEAAVSTNSWINVYGSKGDWLLIQYAISEDQQRFGWITASALAAEVPEAGLREFMWFNVAEDCVLTDDPLGSGHALCQVKAGTEVERMAILQGKWCYVRLEQDGRTWMGFLPLSVMREHLGNG